MEQFPLPFRLKYKCMSGAFQAQCWILGTLEHTLISGSSHQRFPVPLLALFPDVHINGFFKMF